MRYWLYLVTVASVIALADTSFATAPAFEVLDANMDGKLSKAEVAELKDLDFAKADANKDGSLDRSEYENAIS